MFLPILLIDRFGWWGFIAFAVPNVLGCAAFGYVIRTRRRSDRLVRENRAAMRAFSVVTIAYHVFFIAMICWLFLPLEEERFWLVAIIAPPAMLSVGVVLSNLPDRYWPPLAVAVYGFSLAVFASIGLEPLAEVPWIGRIEAINLWWLAPTLIFGFLLCPYLDLTFHRAIRRSPSRHAFAVFGVSFLVMIVLTCAYWDILVVGMGWMVASHIVAQTCFTVAAHVRELRCGDEGDEPWSDSHGGQSVTDRSRESRRSHSLNAFVRSWVFLLLLTLLALPLPIVGEFIGEPEQTALEMYVRFLVFYGLVFPVYVLLFMTGRQAAARTPHRLIAFGTYIIIAAIINELGFIHHQYALLPIPLAAIILWRLYLAVRRHPKVESQP
jgi:hypothetical protein